jgi:hypothetical protein
MRHESETRSQGSKRIVRLSRFMAPDLSQNLSVRSLRFPPVSYQYSLMITERFWRKIILRLGLLATIGQLFTGCASKHAVKQHTFKQWDARLKEMSDLPGAALYTKQDVSLLLGSPPLNCETVPSTTLRIGIRSEADQPAIKLVIPHSPADAAGIRAGFVVEAVNGKPTPSAQSLLSVLHAEVLAAAPISLRTDHGVFEIVPRESKVEQCYWDVRSGAIVNSGGSAGWGVYGGSAVTGSGAHERFYRVSCRFEDDILTMFRSNWQM